MGRRIRDLRRSKGLTQKQLAALVGVRQSAVSGWESDTFPPSHDNLVKLSGVFEVDLSYIQSGLDATPRSVKIPINGIIGAGAKIMMVQDEPIDWADAPPDSNAADLQGFEVRGHSQHPVYRDRDLVFISRTLGANPSQFIGQDCVVELEGGDMMLKVLVEETAPGIFTLGSYNLPDQQGAKVTRATPVVYVKRGARPR